MWDWTEPGQILADYRLLIAECSANYGSRENAQKFKKVRQPRKVHAYLLDRHTPNWVRTGNPWDLGGLEYLWILLSSQCTVDLICRSASSISLLAWLC